MLDLYNILCDEIYGGNVINQYVKDLIKLMNEKPRDFKLDKYSLMHKDFHVWVANGYWFYEIENICLKFNLVDKFVFHLALKRFKQNYLNTRVLNENN